MQRINRKQIILIHLAKTQLGLSDGDYRVLLLQFSRSMPAADPSSKHLSFNEAHAPIEHFKKCGFKIRHSGAKTQRRKGELPPGVTRLPSSQIMSKIDHMREDINWKYHDGYYRWIKKSFGIEKIRTMAEAIKIVEGLKKMLARQETA